MHMRIYDDDNNVWFGGFLPFQVILVLGNVYLIYFLLREENRVGINCMWAPNGSCMSYMAQ